MALDNEAIPQVISNSYGDDEQVSSLVLSAQGGDYRTDAQLQTVPIEYAVRVCQLIGMMGLRGVTVIQSSGDSGVGAPCRANDGSNRVEFTPQYPSTCPYMTSIGGTQAYMPEVVWSASSGGFSNYFKRPWYQEDAIATYLDKHIAADVKEYYKPFANFTGRGFPDVSAHSLTPK